MMYSKFMKLGVLFLAGALASFGAAAHADNINTSAVACQNYQVGAAMNIYYLEFGAGVFRLDNSRGRIVCPVPRSPLTAGATPLFFVDGANSANTSTTCTLFIFSFLGGLNQSQTFTESAGATFRNWDHAVLFPPNSVGVWDYASLVCDLPDGFNAVIHGVTSVQ